jgi:DNA-binding response OmpR family regulator
MARRLLLFEDCGDNICAWLTKGLRNYGFDAHEVNTAEACLEVVRTFSPEAVLMITNNIHTRCPFDVAEAIRSVHPNCGFVFLAGSDGDERKKFRAAGYVFHIREIPLPIPELLAAITGAMDSPLGTFVIPGPSNNPMRRECTA